MSPVRNGVREAVSRNALGLWFCGIAALGVMRCWMKIVREGEGPWPPGLLPWLMGTAACAVVGIALLVRERRRHALPLPGHSAAGDGAS
ncbi:MAG: hypothetical protein V4704_06320 [Pseudomonadota bacterium]